MDRQWPTTSAGARVLREQKTHAGGFADKEVLAVQADLVGPYGEKLKGPLTRSVTKPQGTPGCRHR